ncbi:MAG TPA: hypothetical protein VH619_14675 [Verrucomicrobiae bacterium]|jgi:hypothetical protein|nr:hypothetical protein [Verrucomicrobiae bacterium]
MNLAPLDAVMTGTSFEDATTAIGVFEKGRGGTGKNSLQMICTLDNFIQTFLFNERIFLTICPWVENGRIIPGRPAYRGEIPGRELMQGAGIFSGLPPGTADPEPMRAMVDEIVKPAEPRKSDWFVMTCTRPKKEFVISQEMASVDAYLMEDAIAQAGAQKFKPVFPGEHLYLGLRESRLPPPRITQTMTDLVTNRLRGAIRDKLARLNVFVSQGAPLIPEAPPIYVSRVLRDCSTGADFVPTLLKIRNSSALRNLRAWMAKCAEQALSREPSDRIKAADAWEKFTDYPLEKAVDKTEAAMSVLNVAIDIAKADVMGVLGEVASPIVNYFLSAPFSGIREFGDDKADSSKLESFLTMTFGDNFSRGEMNMISAFLELPGNLKDWADVGAILTASTGRVDASANALARSFLMNIRDPNILSEMMADVDDLKARITGQQSA